jgi:hypothetical protein
MAQPDIIVTAPLPPFLYDPLKADFHCHDYQMAGDKPGLLAAEQAFADCARWRNRDADDALNALPKLEIIPFSALASSTGRLLSLTRNQGDQHARCAHRRRGRRGAGAHHDDRARFGRSTASCTPANGKSRPELTTKLAGKRVGIRVWDASARPSRARQRWAAGLLHRPQAAGRFYRFVRTSCACRGSFLVVSCPGGAATKSIVNAGVLSALGKKGTIVNIARGSIIDEPALVAALQAGTIKGAGLDVFADEPHIPAPLLAMDNVVLLPHVGSATHETRKAMGDLCKANLDAWFAGKPVLTDS